MLIKAGGTTLNVTAVKMIKIDWRHEVKHKKTGLFKKQIEETKTLWDTILYYKDIDGKEASFKWQGSESHEAAQKIENELLNQIKEVELEHMSAALENAIRGN